MLKQVLVIDDDPVNNTIVQKLAEFSSLAEEVLTFVSAVDGLDFIQQAIDQKRTPPEAIFLDINMPIVNGWGFLESFQAMNIDQYLDQVSIYMLTSSSEQSDINKAKQYKSVTDYIVKPISVQKLREIRKQHKSVTA